jgi:uncharacterized membrane-anchored protein YjiN (DUF445 family)
MRSLFTLGSPRSEVAIFAIGDSSEVDKASELERVRFVAAACLVASVLIAVAARALEPRHWGFAYVAACAEAAAVGGLADWYAIVALFRRPLGAPLPHTAIIASNRGRIANAFGVFVRDQFLKPEPIADKLRSVDFAALAADWISDERRSAALARFGMRLLPQALAAVEETGLSQFVGERIMEQLRALDLAPVAAKILSALIEDGRHQRLFDGILAGLRRLLDDERLLETIREKVRRQLPMTFSLLRADAYLVRRFLALTATAIEEAQENPNHPFRRDFDRLARDLIEKLGSSPEYAQQANELKRDFLSRPEVADLAENLWKSVVAFLQDDARSGESVLEQHLARFLGEVGRELTLDPNIRAELNLGVEKLLQAVIHANKHEIGRFITEQINGWDIEAMLWVIELNLGRDLQFIRLNGTFVGGLAGLVLYSAERALHIQF